MLDKIVSFFQNTLDGPLYYVVAVISFIFIIAIIGFLMEDKQKSKELKEKVAVIPTENIEEVKVDSTEIIGEIKVEPEEDILDSKLEDEIGLSKPSIIDFGSTKVEELDIKEEKKDDSDTIL